MKTRIGARGKKFYINDYPVYGEVAGANSDSVGLLWNMRMIQGVFDDSRDRSRFNLFKEKVFDPEKNTENLTAALPQWYGYGLRAFTVGFQGGWPVDCVNVEDILNNPFGEDGKTLDKAYAARMDRVIRAADETGMAVICSLLYWAHANRLKDGKAVADAVRTGCRFLKDGGYGNVIIEVANEYNIPQFERHPIIHSPEGMAHLIRIAREVSGGMPVGSSGGGGMADREVVEESDVVFVHGNGLSRGEYYDFIRKVQGWAGDKPVICNEDSPCVSRMGIGLETYTSWGYYNNYTKQIPPADYGVTPGEDFFFARRMARAVGIPLPQIPFADGFYLQGLEGWSSFHGKRVIRLAAEFPETIDYVDFYCNGVHLYRSYDEPFFLYRQATWLGKPNTVQPADGEWTAEITLNDGRSLKKSV